MLASMSGQWAVGRVAGQRAFGGVRLVEEGDVFSREASWESLISPTSRTRRWTGPR